MVGLLDIGNLSSEVQIRGNALSVSGISVAGLVYLLDKFPEIKKTFSGGETSPEALIKRAPDAVAAAIAAGCGSLGDTAAEAQAAKLSLGEQVELLDVIFRLTFPQGVGPFVAKLTALADGVSAGGDATGWVPPMKLPVSSKK